VTTTSYATDRTALLVVDPYDDDVVVLEQGDDELVARLPVGPRRGESA
jgi:hypothetical protein